MNEIIWDDEQQPSAPKEVVWDAPATMQDRAQAGAAGVNRTVLSALPGLPVDTMLNVWDLAKAGTGYLGSKLGMEPKNLPMLTDRATIPMSSEWLANKERALGLGQTIDPNKPDDPWSRRAFALTQGGTAAALFGPGAAARNFAAGGASQLLPELVAERGGSPSMQVLSSLAPMGATTLASKFPVPPPRQLTTREIAMQEAQKQGYRFPPSLVDENASSWINSAMEKVSGKIASQQAASLKNQPVTQEAIKRDFGIQANVPLTKEVLATVRGIAGTVYETVKGTGTVTPGHAYDSALDAIVAPYKKAAQGFPNATPNPIIAEIEGLRSPQFDAASAVAKISELREKATSAYARGDKGIGKANKDAANAIEDTLDSHLQSIGAPPELIDAYRNARTMIAKTYTVENAINPVSGNVDSLKLARQLAKGKPLTGGILQAAQAASIAPKAMSSASGAAGVSKLDATTAVASALMSFAHPAAALGVLWPMGASATRSAMLSGPYQRTMVKPQTGPGMLRRWADLLPPDNVGLLGSYAMPASQ